MVRQLGRARDPRACKNHFYAWAVPFVSVIPQDMVKWVARISVSANARRISPTLIDPTIKNYYWGNMAAALFQALDLGYDKTVLLDEQIQITEGLGFNIFVIIEGRVVTPKSGMLDGISRKTVIEIREALDIPCEATDISKDDFLNVEEVFTVTTAGGIVPVIRVDARILGNDVMGPLTANIFANLLRLACTCRFIAKSTIQKQNWGGAQVSILSAYQFEKSKLQPKGPLKWRTLMA